MDRVCQFYLRGRCNRSNCEFKHDSSSNKSSSDAETTKICRFYASSNGTCRFGTNCRFSHENVISQKDSDESLLAGHSSDENESMISGFTDLDKKQDEDKNTVNNNSVQDKGETDPLSRSGPSTIKEGKKTIADLSREWSDDEEAGTQGDDERDDEEEEKKKKEGKENTNQGEKQQTQEELDPLIQSSPTTNATAADTSTTQEAPQIISEWSSSLDDNSTNNSSEKKEEWVTLIFGEDGKPSGEDPKSNVYDLNTADTEMEKEREWPLRRRGGAKVRGGLRSSGMKRDGGVTKIGNNMYFYTGSDDSKFPKSNSGGVEDQSSIDSDSQMEESSSEWINSLEEITPGLGGGNLGNSSPSTPVVKQRRRTKKHKAHRTDYVYAGKSTAAKTRRCGECENCNKEDCNKCDACRDKPRNGGKGLKKQACIHRVCLWKNPSGKAHHVPGARPRGRPKTKTAPPGLIKATPPSIEEDNQLLQELSEEDKKKTSSSGTGRLSLPVIAPGTTTNNSLVNNNNQHQKPKDSDLPEFDPDKFKPGYTPSVVKKGDSEYVVVVTGVKDTGLCGKYWSNTDTLPSRRRASSAAAAKSSEDQKGGGRQNEATVNPDDNETTPSPVPVKRTPGRKAKDDAKKATASITSKRKKSDTKKKEDPHKDEQESEVEPLPHHKKSRLDESALLSRGDNNAVSTADDSNNKSNAIRSVSCVADTSTQREVVVECFAPYDDHKWVNIGKERDNMKPDSVQYARALRPPYHLLSFLRIKGNSTKGMSCTDKNTMVFVVLEGEVSVVLHTTQFNAKKGDSFYIPPKNYYNLINQKVREAELSLIQFQYDGPLPTIAASSQSGSAKV